MVLKDMLNIRELARHAECHYTRYLKNQYKDKTVLISGRSFIPKHYLISSRDKEAANKCTNLDDYLPIEYVSNYVLGVSKQYLTAKIKFQQITNTKLYEIKKVNNDIYIKIPEEMKEKMKKKYMSYAVTDFRRFKDFADVKDSVTFGTDLIVFV